MSKSPHTSSQSIRQAVRSKRTNTAHRDRNLLDVFLEKRDGLRVALLRQIPCAADVDDVLGDAALRVLQLDDRGDITDPGAFIYRVTVNVAKDRFKKSRAWREAEEVDFEQAEAATQDRMNPEKQVIDGENVTGLERTVSSLPPKQRSVLEKTIEGNPPRTIAAETGQPIATIKTNLARARANVRLNWAV